MFSSVNLSWTKMFGQKYSGQRCTRTTLYFSYSVCWISFLRFLLLCSYVNNYMKGGKELERQLKFNPAVSNLFWFRYLPLFCAVICKWLTSEPEFSRSCYFAFPPLTSAKTFNSVSCIRAFAKMSLFGFETNNSWVAWFSKKVKKCFTTAIFLEKLLEVSLLVDVNLFLRIWPCLFPKP